MKPLKNANFVKKLMPRSGSYDINCEFPDFHKDSSSLQFNDNLVHNNPNNISKLKDGGEFEKSSNSFMKLFTDVNSRISEVDISGKSFSTLHSKWMGIPLMYLAYFSAFYTLVS